MKNILINEEITYLVSIPMIGKRWVNENEVGEGNLVKNIERRKGEEVILYVDDRGLKNGNHQTQIIYFKNETEMGIGFGIGIFNEESSWRYNEDEREKFKEIFLKTPYDKMKNFIVAKGEKDCCDWYTIFSKKIFEELESDSF